MLNGREKSRFKVTSILAAQSRMVSVTQQSLYLSPGGSSGGAIRVGRGRTVLSAVVPPTSLLVCRAKGCTRLLRVTLSLHTTLRYSLKDRHASTSRNSPQNPPKGQTPAPSSSALSSPNYCNGALHLISKSANSLPPLALLLLKALSLHLLAV